MTSSKPANQTLNQNNNVKWVPPKEGDLKFNVDASVMPGSSTFAVGMVLRDHNGCYLGGKVMRFHRAVMVFEAEVMGIEEALSWSMKWPGRSLCIESDCLLAVQAINKGVHNQLEIGHIIDACRMKLASRIGSSIQHVRRLANRTAHLMARIPCGLNSYIDFMFPPQNVLESLLYDGLSE